MEPQRESAAALGDLLERVLDKGVVLQADLVIGVAGIPLIGISLRAAIAAIETMLEYGMLKDMDLRSRAAVPVPRLPVLRAGERVLLEMYGSYHQARGIWRDWCPGRIVLTDQRLVLARSAPDEIVFSTPVSAVAGIGRAVREDAGLRREVVCLGLEDGGLAVLYASDPAGLAERVRERLAELGRPVAAISDSGAWWSGPGVIAEGQLWHLSGTETEPAAWRCGWAVLTATELTWRGDPPGGGLVRLPLAGIAEIGLARRDLGALGSREVLVIGYGDGQERCEAVLVGDEIGSWPDAIRRAADLAGAGDAGP